MNSALLESELLSARESLARALERLITLASAVPERIRTAAEIESQSKKRVAEVEQLLDKERIISSQRQSLEESAKEEIKSLLAKVEELQRGSSDIDNVIAAKENTIAELELLLADFRTEIARKDADINRLTSEIRSAETAGQELLAKLDAMQEANQRLQEQCLRYESEIAEMESADAGSLRITQDERNAILAEIDALVARLDGVMQGVQS
jgi:chromosome segregation ATPase